MISTTRVGLEPLEPFRSGRLCEGEGVPAIGPAPTAVDESEGRLGVRDREPFGFGFSAVESRLGMGLRVFLTTPRWGGRGGQVIGLGGTKARQRHRGSTVSVTALKSHYNWPAGSGGFDRQGTGRRAARARTGRKGTNRLIFRFDKVSEESILATLHGGFARSVEAHNPWNTLDFRVAERDNPRPSWGPRPSQGACLRSCSQSRPAGVA